MALDLLWELCPHVSSSHIYTKSIYFSQQPSSNRKKSSFELERLKKKQEDKNTQPQV
ncbi:hypothetical protein LguiB_000763 [Lonicera macranthoides]